MFGPTRGVDALFFPAGTYQGPLQEELASETVIALNPRLLNNPQRWRVLGHEFFHVVHHAHAPREADWVKEGLAQKFESEVYGGITQAHLRAALSSSRHALEEPFDTESPSAERYGNAFLFFHHLEQTCGVEQAWRLFFALPLGTPPGRGSLQAVLRGLQSPAPACNDARTLMSDFVIAKLTNQRREGVPRALWPLLPAMGASSADAQALARLSMPEQRRFLEQLPPFLGLKLPAGAWSPPFSPARLALMGIEVRAWDTRPAIPRLLPWNDNAREAAPGVFLLLWRDR